MAKKSIINAASIVERFDSVLAMVAEEIGNEIESGFETCISQFYADYTPHSYDRTGYIYYLSSGYKNYSNLWKRIDTLKYEAGIDIKPGNVPNNAYEKNPHHGLHVTPSFVYNISYMRGIHGFNKSDLTFKRNVKTGELLRRSKKEWSENVYREGKWRPGYKNDVAFNSELSRNDMEDLFLNPTIANNVLEHIKNQYARTYSAKDHTPKNSVAPDVNMKVEFKKIKKSVVGKIDKYMRNLF